MHFYNLKPVWRMNAFFHRGHNFSINRATNTPICAF